jgi:ribonuclease P/MRP protein subunit RPP25
MEKYRLVGEKRSEDTQIAAASADEKPPALPSPATKATAKAEGNIISSTVGLAARGSKEAVSDPHEIRITQQGKPRNYISYAMGLFEHGAEGITLKAMGRAINKCVTISEILKRKMPLHQITTLSSSQIIDVFEPLEEGLDVVESKRYVSCMKVALSKSGKDFDTTDVGYQPPLPQEEIQPGDLNKASFERNKAEKAAAAASVH